MRCRHVLVSLFLSKSKSNRCVFLFSSLNNFQMSTELGAWLLFPFSLLDGSMTSVIQN